MDVLSRECNHLKGFPHIGISSLLTGDSSCIRGAANLAAILVEGVKDLGQGTKPGKTRPQGRGCLSTLLAYPLPFAMSLVSDLPLTRPTWRLAFRACKHKLSAANGKDENVLVPTASLISFVIS